MGLLRWLHLVLFFVKKAYIKLHKADKPTPIGDNNKQN